MISLIPFNCWPLLMIVVSSSAWVRSGLPYTQPPSHHFIYRVEAEGSSERRLSHIMLKLKDVDAAVRYWRDQFNASLIESRHTRHGEFTSAFIALGNGTAVSRGSFALELVNADHVEMGDVLSSIGVSRLFQLGNPSSIRKALMTGAPISSFSDPPPEPNGLPVKWATSSPGDYFCRVCLRTNDINATVQFYKDALGMDVAAADDTMLCLRYHSQMDSGIPTTLVFESSSEPLLHGSSLDHIVIRTRLAIADEFHRLSLLNVDVFMKPATMFGSDVMGVLDPNGYKIVLAHEE